MRTRWEWRWRRVSRKGAKGKRRKDFGFALCSLNGKGHFSLMKKENQLAAITVDLCFRIHQLYGPGLFESVYERILAYEINKLGLNVELQKAIPLVHDELYIRTAFRADMIIDDCLLIELKSIDDLSSVHYKQVLTYLKLTDLKLGLLVNFNVPLIKNGIHRIVNNL